MLPDQPRFDIRPQCADAPWPERGLRSSSSMQQRRRTEAPVKREPARERMPEFIENMRPLDLALLKRLQEFPDAYQAVMEERRRIERAGGA